MRWARNLPGWAGPAPAVRLDALREAARTIAGDGDMYVALTTDPAVERIVDADGGLLPVPAGYTRMGRCGHFPDPMGRFMAEVDVSTVGYPDGMYPMGRVLVLSTVADVAGPVHVASFLPRVRANWQDRQSVEVFAYPDHGLGFTWKTLYGGPGWQKLSIEAGG